MAVGPIHGLQKLPHMLCCQRNHAFEYLGTPKCQQPCYTTSFSTIFYFFFTQPGTTMQRQDPQKLPLIFHATCNESNGGGNFPGGGGGRGGTAPPRQKLGAFEAVLEYQRWENPRRSPRRRTGAADRRLQAQLSSQLGESNWRA